MTGRALLTSLACPLAGLLLAVCCAHGVAADAAPAPLSTTPVAEVPASVEAPAPAVASGPAAAAPRREALPAPRPTAVSPSSAGPSAAGPSAGNLLQTIFGLVVVLALLAGLAWFLKRFGPKHAIGNAGLRIVGALNLGGRERIVVVEVGDQWIVVGASPGRVNALATIPRQHQPSVPLAPGAHAPSATSFSEWLKQTIDKRK